MKKIIPVIFCAVMIGCVALGCAHPPDSSIAPKPSIAPSVESSLLITPTLPPSPTKTPSHEAIHVETISVHAEAKNLYVGDSFTVAVTVLPDNAENKNFKVIFSNEGVLSYENDVFTALASGKTEILFVAEDGGKSARHTVEVFERTKYPTDSRYDPQSMLPVYTPTFEEGVEYVDFPAKSVKHIFTHDLVAFDDPTGYFYDECVTVKEFKEILRQLYENQYVLIDIDYLYEYSYVDGVLHAKYKKTIKVPAGKKPLVLSIDNVAYPHTEYSSARISGLQVVNGALKTFVRLADGEIQYVEDGDVFPILEDFIDAHPDFSFSGAKCVVSPSGRWGVFGWDTRTGAKDYQENVAQAKKVAEWFAINGYAFACHSYYHENMGTATIERIAQDFTMWEKEVYPIIGRTHIYMYPLGARPNQNSAQAKALTAQGYAVFCATSVWAAAWDKNFPDEGNVYAERITISASELYDYAGGGDDPNKERLFKEHALFDPKTVYDNDAHEQKIDW